MADDVEDPVAQAHGELSLARVALAEDDLEHAANHVAGAIAWAPGLPEVHELLAALTVRAGGEVAELFPLREPAFIGTVVARAHVTAKADPIGALRMLAQATGFDPEQPWADVSWVRAADPAGLDPDDLARLFVGVMQRLGDPAPPPVAKANEVWLDLARRSLRAHPDHALLHGASAGLGRRFGDTAEAVRWGARGHRLHPDKLTSVWYAYALRADGRLDAALKVMRAAWRAAPDEVDLCADMANWLADSGRVDEAIELLEEGMRRRSDYDCAVHTVHRLRFQRDGDARHLVALTDFIREHPVVSHEHADLAQACERLPWLGRVTGPAEACVNTLHRIPAGERGTMDGGMSLSALEVPSALAVLRRQLPGVTVRVEGAPAADLVRPLKEVRVLWRYDGTTAYPTVEPAAAASQALLAGIAGPVWPHPVAAYDHAMPLGELPVEQLLSLLVHPPARPERFAELPDGWWERSAQVFACLGLLHCGELRNPADPGDTAAQRRLLTDLAWGVEDWTTEAALFALTVAAWLDPACRVEVCDTVGRRFLAAVRASRTRAVTIRDSLSALVRIVPGMVPDMLALAAEVAGVPAATARTEKPASPSRFGRLFRRRRQ
ncbi:tetratricopeptide repeat protein [Dactylosporangium sp. NPDC050588]|uniref:tetratricopeptide repeat protein n=1 Tax=Dactylosporangium sp. NPDC050588 TaxID=3157211 RepID=UPI0033E30CB5